jgi:ArsR family transcriptional regulator
MNNRKKKPMKAFIRTMKALSDPNRVRVLKLLQAGELCVCEIQNVLGLAQSTVSKHMKLLEDAGLVARKRQGTWIIYSLADGSENEYAAAMLDHLCSWLDDDKELQAMHSALPAAAVLRDCTIKN